MTWHAGCEPDPVSFREPMFTACSSCGELEMRNCKWLFVPAQKKLRETLHSTMGVRPPAVLRWPWHPGLHVQGGGHVSHAILGLGAWSGRRAQVLCG